MALLAPKQLQALPPDGLSFPLNRAILTPKAQCCLYLSPIKALDSSQVELFDNSLPINLIALEKDFHLKYEAGMKFLPEIND